MTRLLFAIPFVVFASAASAQQQGHDACARDATRFCRAYTQQGDMAVRQPGVSCARCLIMQALTAETFGISELQSLNASPVHCARASSL